MHRAGRDEEDEEGTELGMVNERNVHHLHSHVRQLLLYRLVPIGPKTDRTFRAASCVIDASNCRSCI
jgi:hypothetical protein